MIIMNINSWSSFKTTVITNKSLLIQYSEYSDRYEIYASEDNFIWNICILKDEESDVVDFETNHKSTANKSLSTKDNDGSIIVRHKAAKAGWTYAAIPIEFVTSKLDSVVSKLHDNTNRSGITYKIYDNNNVEITTQENEVNAVKTQVDIELPYDFEIIGGNMHQLSKPTTNIRMWVIAAPRIDAPTGSKEMVGGVNLKFIDPIDKVETDGRASKILKYNTTYHTNELRFIIRHNAGVQHDLMTCLEIYKS